MSFGIWPSSMRWTWPSHRSLSRVYILGRPALDRISALDTLSCQDIPRIRRMLLRWKGLGAVAVDGAPWRSTDSGRCRQRNCDLQLTGGAAIGGPEGAQASFPHSTPRPRTSASSPDSISPKKGSVPTHCLSIPLQIAGQPSVVGDGWRRSQCKPSLALSIMRCPFLGWDARSELTSHRQPPSPPRAPSLRHSSVFSLAKGVGINPESPLPVPRPFPLNSEWWYLTLRPWTAARLRWR
ncbi:uncharacterized protein LOC144601032 isoform X1 [Rhinoraja longicauda]